MVSFDAFLTDKIWGEIFHYKNAYVDLVIYGNKVRAALVRTHIKLLSEYRLSSL